MKIVQLETAERRILQPVIINFDGYNYTQHELFHIVTYIGYFKDEYRPLLKMSCEKIIQSVKQHNTESVSFVRTLQLNNTFC